RDRTVTGVQTCALPIYVHRIGGDGTDTVNVDDSGDTSSDVAILTGATIDGLDLGSSPVQTVELLRADGGTFGLHVGASAAAVLRSEERRVGKGGSGLGE